MESKRIAIGKLTPNKGQIEGLPANPRQWTQTDIDRIARSLRETPELFEMRPCIVYPHGDKFVILGGNLRYTGAKANKDKDVPCIVMPEDTPVEKLREIVVKDNSSFGAWDYDALANEWDDLPLQDWGVPAWEEEKEPATPEVKEDDFNEDAEVETRCNPGDIWQLGEHRLMCGDSTDGDKVKLLFGKAQPYAIVTDPPYCSGGFQESGKKSGSIGTRDNIMIANDTLSTRGYMSLIKRVFKVAGEFAMAYVFTDWRMFVNLFDCMEELGFGVRNMIVWDKGTPGMGVGWRSQHEICLFASRSAEKFNPHLAQGNVIQCARTGNINHPTEKPVELIGKILRVTDMAEEVYDPFGGSGTTLIAAEQLGRRCYMMELDPHYCDVIISRWETFTGKTAQLITPGDKVS